MDDCSTDASCYVVDRYPEPVRLIKLPKHRGTNGALNVGLQEVKTSHVYFGAADDFVLPGFFDNAACYFQGSSSVGLFYCPAEWHDYRTKLTWRMGTDTGSWSTSFIPTSSAVCNTDHVLALGGLRNDLGCYADWFLVRCLAHLSGWRFSPVPGSRFHLYPDSYSNNGAGQETLSRLANEIAGFPCSRWNDLLPQFGMPMREICPDLPLLPCLKRSAETWARKHLPAVAQKLLLRLYANAA